MKKLYISIILTHTATWLWGQSCDLNKNEILLESLCPEIATTLQQGDATVVARDAITLKPGFTLTTGKLNNHTFTAKVDHNQVVETAGYATTSSGTGGLPNFSTYVPVPMGGVVDVSPTGAATYQIPIQVSPGSNGMQPGLSVVYSSQSGNGMLGWGWNLAGLSAITRTSKNPYYDNTVQPVMLDETDVFALDGVRLIKDGVYYYLSNNPYTQIEFVGSQKFKLTTQDGVVMEFGFTDISPNSQFKGVGSSVPYSYALSRITDPNGNYIDYLYANDPVTGEYRISEIKYTGNSISGKSPYNSVKFYYDLRNDPSSFYIKGSKVSQTILLTSIKVYCEGILSKNYEFTYMFNENSLYSKLRMVTLTADGNNYAPVIINWGETSNYNLGSGPNIDLSSMKDEMIFYGDANGDGVTDIIRYKNNEYKIVVHFGGTTTVKTINLPVVYPNPDETIELSVKDIIVADLASEGKDKILFHYTTNVVNNSNPKYPHYSSYDIVRSYTYNISTGEFDESVVNHIVVCEHQSTSCSSSNKYSHYFVDITNNGTVNHIIVNSKLLHSISNINLLSAPSQIGEFDNLFFIDFNGDGRLDILFLKDNGEGTVWSYSEGLSSIEEIMPLTYITKSKNLFFPGDFNGDGKTDYIGYSSTQGWIFRYSNGDEFLSQNLPQEIDFSSIPLYNFLQEVMSPDPNIDEDLYQLQKKRLPSAGISVDDINNDGKSDILYINNNVLYASLNNGSSFKNVYIRNYYSDYYTIGGSLFVINAFDYNSDGRKEILYCSNKYSSNNLYQPYSISYFDQDLDKGFYVNSISNGVFYKSTFTYTPYSDKQLLASAYPLLLLRSPLKLVTNLTTVSDTIKPIPVANITYTYSNGYLHLQGLGFLGFQNVSSFDAVTKQSAETQFQFTINNTPGVYMPWPKIIRLFRDGIALTSTENTMEVIGGDYTRKFFMPVVSQILKTDHLKVVTSTSSITYNSSYGRISGQNVSISGSDWGSVASYTYALVADKSSKLLGVTTITTNQNGSFESTLSLSYDTGLPFRVKSKTEQAVTTTFNQFDAYGNVTSASMSGRTNTSTYDARGRFVESSTDFGGYTIKSKYRATDGAILSHEGHTGLITTYSYSSGSESLVTTINLPDGKVTTKRIEWVDGKSGYKASESLTYGNTVTEEYDLAGRKIKQTYKGFDGALRTKEFTYNNDGTLNSESLTGFTNSTTYEYWPEGRIKAVTDFTGNRVSYSYRNLRTTEEDPLTGTEYTHFDAVGNVKKVESGLNGVVEYAYWPSGKTKEIKANQQVVASMTYDDRGNQLSLNDVSAGLTSYQYNIFNEIVSQTDSEGNTIAVNYNNDGSVSSKTLDGNSLVEYTYYEDQLRKGMLKDATRSGVKETYEYDYLGRPTKVIVNGAGKTFTTELQYGGEGRLDYVTHPTGLQLKYSYDEVGNLYRIDDASSNSKIWEGEKDNRDFWINFTLGNNLVTQYNYNSTSLLLESIKTGTVSTPTSVQNLGFSYNSKRLLSQRTDGARLLETFTYDTKNRLASSQVQGKLPFEVTYSDNGNVTSTTQSGNYTYGASGKPYAVTEVADPAWQSVGLNLSIDYTGDNRISSVSSGTFTNSFTYSPSGQRFRVDHVQGATLQKSKIYVGNSEFLLDAGGNITESRTFITAPTGICAVYSKVGSNPAEISYIHTDHLGSWLVKTSSAGNVLASQSFDTWGRPRNPSTWELLPVDLNNPTQAQSLQPTAFFDRGYTGHEHMAGFGLINMNGRVYDPYLQRFLSPDPIVQEPGNAQNFNRYSYVLNNPLMNIDPSGYSTLDYQEGINNMEINYGGWGFNHGWDYSPWLTNGTTFGRWSQFIGPGWSKHHIRYLINTYTNPITGQTGYWEERVIVVPNNDDEYYPDEAVDQVSIVRTWVAIIYKTKNKVTTWDEVTNERIAKLHSDIRGPATNFINQVESELGIQLRVTQGLRTFAEQNKLYAKGRTSPGTVVTNAKGGQSFHNYGLAIDVVEIKNGNAIWDTKWYAISEIGIRNGFEWGGNFNSFSDKPHFQMTFGYSYIDLLNLYNSGQWQ